MDADFETIGKITDVETIAMGRSIRELPQLQAPHVSRAGDVPTREELNEIAGL